MAKSKGKKKGNNGQASHMSPERFMREKARTLPIGKCFVTEDWRESGICQVVVTRVRPSGNIASGIFLVDTFCLGVKDAYFYPNMSEIEFGRLCERLEETTGVEEISYNEAHNLIYGAIAFAEEGGIQPAKGFALTRFILEEDTEDVPLIEYEFGKDGRHFLIVDGENRKEMPYVETLRKNLGDNFDYIVSFDDDEEYDDEEYEDDDEEEYEDEEAPTIYEPYSYDYPEYPKTLSLKYQFIADELLNHTAEDFHPDELLDRILALPVDEAARDLSALILYEIGRTYKQINDGEEVKENDAIITASILLAELRSPIALGATLELMSQHDDFLELHMGYLCTELLHRTLYACGMNDVPAIEDFINTPGHNTFMRHSAIDALAMIAENHPERRAEIIDVYRRILTSMVDRLPCLEACDPIFSDLFVNTLVEIDARELLPEIEALYSTGCLPIRYGLTIEEVTKDLTREPRPAHNDDRFKYISAHEIYDGLKSWQH